MQGGSSHASGTDAIKELNDLRVPLAFGQAFSFAVFYGGVDANAEELSDKDARFHDLTAFRQTDVGFTPNFEVVRVPARLGPIAVIS